MKDALKGRTYEAQHEAFAGTLLAESPGFIGLKAITERVIDSAYWRTLVGWHRADIGIEQIQSNTIGGDADHCLRHIRYVTTSDRYVVPHEMAHIASGLVIPHDHQAHGPEWRGLFIELVDVIFGAHYGRLLHDAFVDAKLRIDTSYCLGWTTQPIIDIDAVVGVTRGGWKR